MSPKPTQHVWAWKRPSRGEVTVHRGDDDRYTDVDGWVTICNRIVPGADYRWLWVEYRTLNPDLAFLCGRCWR